MHSQDVIHDVDPIHNTLHVEVNLAPWTESRWSAYEPRKHAYKGKVGAMFPSVVGFSLVLSSVQAEGHTEQVSHGLQPC